jgi:hypothetical protein
MDRKFDVTKWRNDQYNKEIELADEIAHLKNVVKEEIKNFLTEEVVTKTIESLTFDDVKDLALPTKTKGVYRSIIKNRDLIDWKENWDKDTQVTIDPSAIWFDKVKIKDISQTDYMGYMDKTTKNPKLD